VLERRWQRRAQREGTCEHRTPHAEAALADRSRRAGGWPEATVLGPVGARVRGCRCRSRAGWGARYTPRWRSPAGSRGGGTADRRPGERAAARHRADPGVQAACLVRPGGRGRRRGHRGGRVPAELPRRRGRSAATADHRGRPATPRTRPGCCGPHATGGPGRRWAGSPRTWPARNCPGWTSCGSAWPRSGSTRRSRAAGPRGCCPFAIEEAAACRGGSGRGTRSCRSRSPVPGEFVVVLGRIRLGFRRIVSSIHRNAP
jgi:hypothetical protein